MEPIRRPHASGPLPGPDLRPAPLRRVALPLDVGFRDPSRPLQPAAGGDARPGDGAPLAALVFGDDPAPAAAPMTVRVPLPRVGGAPTAEVWNGPQAAEVRRHGPVTLALAGPVAFAAVTLAGAGGRRLEALTAVAYRELLTATDGAGFPHLLRVWAVLPGINEEEDGLERYRRFCRARAEAMESHYGAGFTAQLSASTGVGSAATGDPAAPLVIYALAARLPGRHRENPRQLAAYRYPPAYGPRSPAFARATLCPAELGRPLLISGTAAIVGHRSLHPGSVRRQTGETLANLARLAAGRPTPPGLPYRQLKVYLRAPDDRAVVEAELRRRLGPEVPMLFLRADICRRELDVEVEGVA